MNAPKLTDEEQQHTMAALHFLRKRLGTWRIVAKALGFEPSTMRNVRKGTKRVSVNMAYRVAKVSGAAFDDVVTGRWPVPGTCPHCGRGPKDDHGTTFAKG